MSERNWGDQCEQINLAVYHPRGGAVKRKLASTLKKNLEVARPITLESANFKEVAMYRIIGADGKNYGPVTTDQMRQWISEGRVNAQTMVQAEGGTEWKSLAGFPELMGASVSVPTPPAQTCQPATGIEARKSKIAAGLLGILLGGWGIHRFYLGYVGIGVAQIFVTLFTCGIGALWGFIEGILILCNSSITTDAQGRPLKD